MSAAQYLHQQALERLASECHNTILTKIWAGAEYGAKAYLYQESRIINMELNSTQCILLALLNSLMNEEVAYCCILADMCHKVQQLQSIYLKFWLNEDFVFPRQDIEKAVATLIKLLEAEVLKLPSIVVRIMSSLAEKYGIDGDQLTSLIEEGPRDLAHQMEKAVIRNSPGDIITIANKGGDINGMSQSGDSFIHLATSAGYSDSILALGYLKADLEDLNSRNATPLEEAVKKNHLPSVNALLRAGAKTNKRLYRGDTYLHIAAAGGSNRALEVLLENGMNVNDRNHFGETPLFLSVRGGNVQGMMILLDKGADVSLVPEGEKSIQEMVLESQNVDMFKALVKWGIDLKFKDGNTVLHLIACSGSIEMLKVIKDVKSHINIKNESGMTPLQVATDAAIVRGLIRIGADVNIKSEKGETSLHIASAKDSLDVVKALAQHGVDVDSQDDNGVSALMIACVNNKVNIVKFLLHNGANPRMKDRKGQTPLHYAAEGGCVGSVRALLDARVKVDDIDNEGNTPAFISAQNNKPDVLQLLVGCGADLALRDCNGNGIIHREASSGSVEVVKALLDAGVAVDITGQYQDTALHWAAKNGHSAVVEVLLEAGALVDMKNQYQNTALYCAAIEGHSAVVAALLEAGALVEMKNQYQRTALHCAAWNGHSEVVAALLDAGADMEAKESSSFTPLMLASNQGHSTVVKLLIARGALLNVRDKKGNTALKWAILNKCKTSDVIEYLKSIGGIE